MASYRELLQQVKSEIEEISSSGAAELLESHEPPVFLDVRENDAWEDGHMPDSLILRIGAGGLASPASIYHAAAGVGTLGIVDDDAVDASNLQRQIVHSLERRGESKAESAKRTIEALNPDVTVETFQERITS